MSYFFSAQAMGFYPDGVHASMPPDARPVSDEVYQQLVLTPTPAGKELAADENGDPILKDTPGPNLAQRRAAALARVNSGCETALAMLKAAYPGSEVDSWAKQEAEARTLATDPAAPALLLSAIAAARGIEVAELAARVLAKADAYAVAAGQLIGHRQALKDVLAVIDLDAPDAEASIDAIRWEALDGPF